MQVPVMSCFMAPQQNLTLLQCLVQIASGHQLAWHARCCHLLTRSATFRLISLFAFPGAVSSGAVVSVRIQASKHILCA